MCTIRLKYLVEYQYENGAWNHFLCADYTYHRKTIIFSRYDSYGNPCKSSVRLGNIKVLTIKTIGERDLVYEYTNK